MGSLAIHRAGARWLRCDLHVHTPFDPEKKFKVDVRGAITAFKNGEREKLARIAQDFIDACRRAADGNGLDLIAITDHNSIEGFRTLRPLFEDIARQAAHSGKQMTAPLPGVEFSVGGERPLHFLVIFAADTDPDLIDRAIHHVFGTRDRFNARTGTPCATGQSVEHFLEKLYGFCQPTTGERHLEMVVLPAHADGHSGLIQETTGSLMMQSPEAELVVSTSLWDEMKGHLRERVITRRDWHGFQTLKPYGGLPTAYRDLLASWAAARLGHNWEELSKEERKEIRELEHWPLIEASDPHNFDAIGKRFTWLKMEVPDIEGIRLSLLDPESRLRRMSQGPPGQDYPRIKRIRVRETDFFTEIDVSLSPCLTTLIGGRGSGKSTIIELLRYALDRYRTEDFGGEDEQNTRKNVNALLKTKMERDFGESEGVLLPGHEIIVDLVLAGRPYRVTRTAKAISVTMDPGTLDECTADLDVRALIQPRILSQRQISQIARDPSAQRRELDAHIDADQQRLFQDEQHASRQRLRELQVRRDRVEKGLISLPSRRTELQTIKDRIAFLEQGDRRETFERFQKLDRERRWLDDRLKALRELQGELSHRAEELETGLPSAVTAPAALDESGWLASLDERIGNAVVSVAAALRAQVEQLGVEIQSIQGERQERWAPGFDEARAAYESLRDELAQRGVDFGQHRKLLQQRAMIEREVNELEKSRERLENVRGELASARLQLEQLHERRLERRRERANALAEADADVRLEVLPFRDRTHLSVALQQWFSGSGVRESDREVLLDYLLAEGGSVVQRLGALSRAVRSDIAVAAAGVNPTAVDSEVGKLLSEELRHRLTGYFWNVFSNGHRLQLDEMERFIPEDLVVMRARGPDGRFRPITQGSLGQRSTAILSLVLFSGQQPLIVDQPEDDLDNKYIYDVVVDLLRRRKFSRQIVVATHNANIPVNGDAELIVALEVPEGKRTGEVAASGSIDSPKVKTHVSTIMEGSAEAFRLRRERYGY